jgi:hypothetical protein
MRRTKTMLAAGVALAAVSTGLPAWSDGRSVRKAAQPDQQLTAKLTRHNKATRLLWLEGPGFERGAATDTFDVLRGRINSLPCTGTYDFISIGRFPGYSIRYEALIAIRAISRRPRSLQCGRGLPRRVGRRKTTIEIRKAFSGAPRFPRVPLRLDLKRRRSGHFRGTIRQRAVLCIGQFRLIARFKGQHRTRVYSYRFLVRDATLDGTPRPRCSEL